MDGPPPSDSRDAVPSRTNLQDVHVTCTLALKVVCSLACSCCHEYDVGCKDLCMTRKTSMGLSAHKLWTDSCIAEAGLKDAGSGLDEACWELHLPPEVTGRVVPGLPPRRAASMEPVPGLVPGLIDVAGLYPVPGLAKPVRGLPLPVTGRTAWLEPCQNSVSCMSVSVVTPREYCQSQWRFIPCQQRWSWAG